MIHSRTPSDSFSPSSFKRPAAHPQISRLRSTSTQLQRFPSSSSHSTFFDRARRGAPNDSNSNSGFDLMSRVSSISNLNEVLLDNSDTNSNAEASTSTTAPTSILYKAPTDTFKWSPLRRISQRIYPPISSLKNGTQSIGVPTVLAVSGIIAVGTTKGWVMIFDFAQNLRCMCGSELIG